MTRPPTVALFTPMKGPDHKVPSGDRTFARLVAAALAAGGHTVVRPTELAIWCAEPDRLAAVEAEAAAEVDRIAAGWRVLGPADAILTYHSYHKAPDLVGPPLAARFALPYAILEASRAPKRESGPWARGFALADAALAEADAVGAVTGHDAVALAAHVPDKVVRVPPFVDTAPFRRPNVAARDSLVSAAMMRPGRKADSVRVLADVLAAVRSRRPGVSLALAGDGAERAALAPLFPAGTMRGLTDADGLAALYARAALFVWPAIDEPFGFAFLEAQAAGLPVVGGAAPGVAEVVVHGETGLLVPPRDVAAMAQAVLSLLADDGRRAAFGARAREFASANDLAAGTRRLEVLLARAALHRAARVARGAA